MATMRAVQVSKPGGALELVERELPEPGTGEVRVRIQACGVCHSDVFAKEGGFPGTPYPIIPGHEIAGVIDAIGEGVNIEGRGLTPWTVGTRVGVGWFGGHCGRCDPCRRGDFISCSNLSIPGVTRDGGYAEAIVVPYQALARIPDDLAAEEAAPLLCAGVTTYNALRHSDARPGDVVAVVGVGGLGHLAVQFAAKMGFRTVAIGRGGDKAELARQLGACIYIDSEAQDGAAELTKLGGAKAILATVPSPSAMTPFIPGLAPRGQLIVIGVGPEPVEASTFDLVGGSRTVRGHASGASIDSEDTLNYTVISGVRPQIETLPLERAAEAYEKMASGKARFRMVLTTA